MNAQQIEALARADAAVIKRLEGDQPGPAAPVVIDGYSIEAID